MLEKIIADFIVDTAGVVRLAGTFEWYTPEPYIALARKVLGNIDLDPASCAEAQKTVCAAKFFSKEDDELRQPWNGRVWVNPPYCRDLMSDFVAKLIEEFCSGRTIAAILLSHSYRDTKWFHDAAACAAAICFTRGRIKFTRGDEIVAVPTSGQSFFYFGPDAATFERVFCDIGFVRCNPIHNTRAMI